MFVSRIIRIIIQVIDRGIMDFIISRIPIQELKPWTLEDLSY